MKQIKQLLYLTLLTILTLGSITVHAQTGSAGLQSIPQNLSNVNVNDLTDAQIRQMLQQASSSGISDNQLLQQAANRGLPDDQIQLLQKRIADVRSKDGTTSGSTGVDTSFRTSRRLNYVADSDSVSKENPERYKSNKPKIFGADLFSNKNLKFEPNLKIATPINYILGPDDQVYINVYGKSVANWKLEVSPDGNINIPGVGIVHVAGKTIEQAGLTIKSKLSTNNYAIGRGTSVEISLGNIRSIKVIIAGQVTRPGSYTLPSLATVFNA
ncbi:polysaccharide biosynthesis/export protein, partial [Mucilaginibacter frigoritolerans]